eukprot:1160883-Pelagomonas_calceolata.AAC.12
MHGRNKCLLLPNGLGVLDEYVLIQYTSVREHENKSDVPGIPVKRRGPAAAVVSPAAAAAAAAVTPAAAAAAAAAAAHASHNTSAATPRVQWTGPKCCTWWCQHRVLHMQSRC